MLINDVAMQTKIDAEAEKVIALRTAFEAKRDVVVSLRHEIATHRKAAEAAEAEAEAAREETKGMLRRLTGPMSKSFRDLKAKERAAYTLAEDYREVVAELEQGLAEVEFDAGELLTDYKQAANQLRGAYADALIEQGLSQLPPALVAGMRMKAAFRERESRWVPWRQYTLDTADEHVLKELLSLLPAALNHNVELPDLSLDGVLVAPTEAGIAAVTSPAVRSRVARERAASAQSA